MQTDKIISNPIARPSSDPDSITRGIQETQYIVQRNLILFILHTILSSTSSQRSKQTRRQGSLRISRIGAYTLYYETRTLSSITKSLIYNKEKREKVKIIILYKSAMDSNAFLFEPANPKIGHN